MRSIGVSNLDVYVTGRCNYKCEYCYGEQDCAPDMSVQTYQRALDFATYIGAKNIQMCGGEPLVCKNFKIQRLGRSSGLLGKDDFDGKICPWN